MKDALIVLLDEVTSNLNADNELETNAALDQLMANNDWYAQMYHEKEKAKNWGLSTKLWELNS